MDKGEEVGSEFVEASSNPMELLELEEEGLHKMTLRVRPKSYENLQSSVE